MISAYLPCGLLLRCFSFALVRDAIASAGVTVIDDVARGLGISPEARQHVAEVGRLTRNGVSRRGEGSQGHRGRREVLVIPEPSPLR